MEYNVFRDYCKAENSDDEEVNDDIQSRLYAEIYYAPNDTVNQDTKTSIKLETFIDHEKHLKDAGTKEVLASNDTFLNNSSSINKMCKKSGIKSLNDSMNNIVFITEDDKLDIKSISVTNEVELLANNISNSIDSSVACLETLEHSEDNTVSHSSNPKNQLSTCHSLKAAESSSKCDNKHNMEEDMKPEIEIKNKEKLKITECLKPEGTETEALSSIKQSNSNSYKLQKVASTEMNKNDCDNIFKKYQSSQLYINKLYLKKYETLERRLREMQEEKEVNSINMEHMENYQQQKVNSPAKQKQGDSVEMNTKYEVLSKTAKVQKQNNCLNETVLLSESDSDSAESILEVPIPPKPQPPIINLKDSDESSDECNSDSDSAEDIPLTLKEKNDLVATGKRTCTRDEDSDSNTAIATTNCVPITEDIMINCTEVQKVASSIKEIRDLSQAVQSAQNPVSRNTFEKERSSKENEAASDSFNDSVESSLLTDDQNILDTSLSPKQLYTCNYVHERDKYESINFAEDVMVSNFLSSNEKTPTRKRYREDDDEVGTSTMLGGDTGNGSKRSKPNPVQDSQDKNRMESWEEYFFRPMSDNVKAFYNESRGQENFDMEMIQSKMSRDPRLWAILDEDLMPHLLTRHRYWNVRCNNCQQQGHPKHNCPESLKPIRCYMCGTQGHSETRCPQKMCLTCGKKQGIFRKTCESCRILYCSMCKAIGHKSTECPDLWRRFHQTTRISEINIPDNLSEVMKPADLLYCCNCTKRGHDSSMCHEYRWSQHFPTPAFVSSYIDGPVYDGVTVENTNMDVIPLSVPKKKKNRTVPITEDDIGNHDVIFTYGKWQKSSGEQIKRTLSGEQVRTVDIKNVLNGSILPSFLDEILKLVSFDITIYYNIKRELMIRVRSVANVTTCILDIFVYWLRLEDEDKKSQIIRFNLPRSSYQLHQMLTKKLEKIEKNVKDPNSLCDQIKDVKLLIANDSNPAVLRSNLKKLLDLRTELIKAFNAKLKPIMLVNRLKKAVKGLKTSPEQCCLPKYLSICVLYNKIFLPRALRDSELQNLLQKYYAKLNKQTRRKENQAKKSQKKENTPYESFIQSLKKSNETVVTNKIEINKKANKAASTVNSSKNVAKQEKHVATVTSTAAENMSDSTSVHVDAQIVTQRIDNISTQSHNIVHNAAEITNASPVEDIQVSFTGHPTTSNKAANAIKKSNLSVSSNVVAVTNAKPTDTKVQTRSKNVHSTNVHSVQTTSSKRNTESNLEIIIDDSEGEESHTVPKIGVIDLESTTPKVEKSKKEKKAKTDLQSSSQITKTQMKNIDTALQKKANQIINEALAFNVPYMNLAAEEVKKKINDKNLKQEHVDTLQRLINLENDHRKYISSFCNYLQ